MPVLPISPGGLVGLWVKLGHVRHDVIAVRRDVAAPERHCKVIVPVRCDRLSQLRINKSRLDAAEQAAQGSRLKIEPVVPNRCRRATVLPIGMIVKTPKQRDLTMFGGNGMGAVAGGILRRRLPIKCEIGRKLAKDFWARVGREEAVLNDVLQAARLKVLMALPIAPVSVGRHRSQGISKHGIRRLDCHTKIGAGSAKHCIIRIGMDGKMGHRDLANSFLSSKTGSRDVMQLIALILIVVADRVRGPIGNARRPIGYDQLPGVSLERCLGVALQ
jgi:hypothetical protein